MEKDRRMHEEEKEKGWIGDEKGEGSKGRRGREGKKEGSKR